MINMKKWWQKYKEWKKWKNSNKLRMVVIDLGIGLPLVLGLYFIGRYFYTEKLNTGKQCYTKTIYTGIDKKHYVHQVEFKFVTYTGDTIKSGYAETVNVSKFDYSKTYTVRYLESNPRYKELILEDWNESKYKADDNGCLVPK